MKKQNLKNVRRQQAIKKNTPREKDTEVNSRIPEHMYRNLAARDGVDGLPIKELPRHRQSDDEDETALDAEYTLLGL